MEYYGIHYETEHETVRHSDVYLGSDASDGIRHWKYIRKYKAPSGKWVYVYASKKTHQEIERNQKQAKKENRRSDSYVTRALNEYNLHGKTEDFNRLYYSHKASLHKATQHFGAASKLMKRNSLQGITLRQVKKANNTIKKAKAWLAGLFK